MERGNPSVLRLAQRQVLSQRVIEWPIREQQVVIHSRRPCMRAQLLDVRIDFGSIGGFRVLRNDFNSLVCLKVDKEGRAAKDRPDLLWIKDVKKDDLIAAEPQWRNFAHDRRGISIE